MSLDAAHRAFEEGDFYTARRLARQLKASASDGPTQKAADELLRRTSYDPLIVWLTVGCAFMFGLVIVATLAR
jgi:hypothetical protein